MAGVQRIYPSLKNKVSSVGECFSTLYSTTNMYFSQYSLALIIVPEEVTEFLIVNLLDHP